MHNTQCIHTCMCINVAFDLSFGSLLTICLWNACVCWCVSNSGKRKSTSKRQMSANMCQKRFYVIWKIMKTLLQFAQCKDAFHNTIDSIARHHQMETFPFFTYSLNTKMCSINIDDRSCSINARIPFWNLSIMLYFYFAWIQPSSKHKTWTSSIIQMREKWFLFKIIALEFDLILNWIWSKTWSIFVPL